MKLEYFINPRTAVPNFGDQLIDILIPEIPSRFRENPSSSKTNLDTALGQLSEN